MQKLENYVLGSWRAGSGKLAQLHDPESDEFRRRLDQSLVKDFYAWLHANGVRRSALCSSRCFASCRS